jgi:murein DD-endopeptidase MepM/ murein hydrolase activator NlpD
MGLMDYDARFYSPTLGRFTQPDSIVPDLTNSQAWNRYSYSYNNPSNYTDNSGHIPEGECGFGYGGCGTDGYTPDEGNENTRIEQLANLDKEVSVGLRRGMTSEELFMMAVEDPLHNPDRYYHGFGSCNTKTGSCVQHHPGVDVGPGDLNNPDTDIHTIGYGEVTYVGKGSALGKYIIIKHTMYGEDFYSVYAHLVIDSVTVNVGDEVNSNTLIAQMGNSGTGSVHLHFEVRTSLGIGNEGVVFKGSGVHPDAPGDAYWAYSREDLDIYWGNLSLLSWVGDYDTQYSIWP